MSFRYSSKTIEMPTRGDGEQSAFGYTSVPMEEISLQPNESRTDPSRDEDTTYAADTNGSWQSLRREQADEFYLTALPLSPTETRYLGPSSVRGNVTSRSGKSVGGHEEDETIQAASIPSGSKALTEGSENKPQDEVEVAVALAEEIDPLLPVDGEQVHSNPCLYGG